MQPSRQTTTAVSATADGKLILAVDAGGTKTAAWIARSRCNEPPLVLGRGYSSAGNPLAVGFEQSTRAIAESVDQARRQANLPDPRPSRAVLSIAGAADPDSSRRFVHWAHQRSLADQVATVSDVLPVLAAGTPDCCGIALVAGTGSVAFGRTRDGRTIRTGGWGYLLGDDGSGYAIGRAALRLALFDLESHADRASLRPLTRQLLAKLRVDQGVALERLIYNSANPRTAIADVAPLVMAAADEGDADAKAILDAAARDLAQTVVRAARRLQLDIARCPLAMGGGVLARSLSLRDRVALELRNAALECDIHLVTDPLHGCLRLATTDFAPPLITWH